MKYKIEPANPPSSFFEELKKLLTFKKSLTFFSIAVLALLYQNFTVQDVQTVLSGKSPTQVYTFYQNLMTSQPNIPGATQYVLQYSNNVTLTNGATLPLGNNYGVGAYNKTLNRVEITLNPAFENDPIISGFVIAHEMVHGLTGFNPSHPLSGSFSTGTNSADFDSLDHLYAYQSDLGLWPDLVAEYTAAGDTAKAGLYAAAFDQARAQYESIKAEMSRTVSNLDTGLSQNVNGLSNAQVINGVAVSGNLTLSSTNLNSNQVSMGLGPYLVSLTYQTGNQSFTITFNSSAPLSNANISTIVKNLVKKIAVNQAMLSQSLTTTQLNQIRNILLAKLTQPSFSPSETLEVFRPPSIRDILERMRMEGVKITGDGSMPGVGSVEIVQGEDNAKEIFRQIEYKYTEPSPNDGGLGGCGNLCPNKN